MIVDDSPTDCKVLSDMLTSNGYTVVTLPTAEQALSEVKTLKPDLVLMDVVLPGQSGFQATRALSKDESTKHIPVIVCSSKSQDTDRIWGLRQGARDYLVKPVKQADLLAKIV